MAVLEAPAIPALGEVLVAAVYAMFALAALALVDSILKVLVPVLPGAFQGAAQALRDLAVANVLNQEASFDAGINALSWTWSKVWNSTYGYVMSNVQALAALRDLAVRLVTLTIPNAVQAAQAVAAGWLAEAEGYTLSLYQQGAAELQALGASLGAALGAAEARLGGQISLAYAASSEYARSLVTAEGSWVAGLFGQAEADAAALVAQEAALARSGEVALGAFVQQSVGVALGYEQQIGAALGADIQAGVSALEQDIAQLQAKIAAPALAMAAAAVADIALIRAMRCMQACNVLGAVGEGLQLLDLAAILALTELAAHDPKAVEGFIAADVAPLVNGTLSAARSTLGL